MDSKFNLLDEPWIPIVRGDRQSEEVSLQEALVQAHNLVEINAVSPLVVASLHRLLLAIVHRVFGPADHDAWAKLWSTGQWDADALSAYFARWHQRFNLFDEDYPFYQCRDVQGGIRTTNWFCPERASGNNAMLFDHQSDNRSSSLSPDEAARLLVTSQVFGLAGLSGLPEKFTDGPWGRGSIFLVQGNNLFETLMLNMILYPPEMEIFPTDSNTDNPIWELDAPWADDRSIPHGYLDYLTWPSRRVLLKPEIGPDGMTIRELQVVPGLRLDPAVLDPAKLYRIDPKRGTLPIRFEENRDLWRDSVALFRLSDHAGGEYRRPAAFRLLESLVARRVLARTAIYRYMALGMCNDQAKINFWRQERMPLPLAYVADRELVGQLAHEVLEHAEMVGKLLWAAAQSLARELLSPLEETPPDKNEVNRLVEQMAIERHYWSKLELPFRQVLETMPDEPDRAQQMWDDTLRKVARTAFEQAARGIGTSARALKAATLSRGLLDSGLKRHLPIQDLAVPK